MAKVMLIMDMPSSCADCILRASPNPKEPFCVTNFKNISDDEYYKQKPDWCPLRKCPQKKETKTLNEFLEEKQDVKVVANFVAEEFMKYGYNTCIDEILGGGE